MKTPQEAMRHILDLEISPAMQQLVSELHGIEIPTGTKNLQALGMILRKKVADGDKAAEEVWQQYSYLFNE